MSAVIKSPWVLHYDASSCNGCDIEVLAALTPLYDVERFGIINTGNPKHADVFLITGSVNERQVPVIRQLYEQMPEPKVVVACGVCACTGGVFKECYNTLGGADVAIPVDVYAPGCAIRPETIIDAVVQGLGRLEEKRALLAQGKLVPSELPPLPSAADKTVHDKSVAHTWKDAIAQAQEAPLQKAPVQEEERMKQQGFEDISLNQFIQRVGDYKEKGWRFANLNGSTVGDKVELLCSFALDKEIENLLVLIEKDEQVPAISTLYPSAFAYENEVRDLFGVNFKDITLDYGSGFIPTSVPTPMNPCSLEAEKYLVSSNGEEVSHG